MIREAVDRHYGSPAQVDPFDAWAGVVEGEPGDIDAVSVLSVDGAAERAAWDWLRRHDERSYSFVAATSFAIMRRERISEALAFDADFSAAGFVEVRPPI